MREDQVRELLGLAGATIEVGPGAAVETGAGRRRWPYVAGAAAAAVAIAASVLVGVTLSGDQQDADPGPQGNGSPDMIQVAGVYGMPVDLAKQQLEAQGLTVEVTHVETCEAPLGRSLRTTPVALSTVDPGSEVTLEVAMQGNSVGVCPAGSLVQLNQAWQFVDYLLGWTPTSSRGPGFGPPVTYTENGTGTQVQGLRPEPDAFGILAARVRGELALPGSYLRAELDDGRDFACAGLELPRRLQDRDTLWFEITRVEDGPTTRCTMVNLVIEGIDPPGSITEVVLRSSDNPLLDELSEDAQNHAQHFDVDADAEAVAARFLAAVQPDSPISMSPYAEQVDLLIGNELVRSVVGGTLHGNEAWDVCPSNGVGYAERGCPVSVVDVLRQTDPEAIVLTGTHPAYGMCAEVFPGEQPPDGRFVVLGLAEPEACLMSWNVELYYDADQRITAVNLLLGSP